MARPLPDRERWTALRTLGQVLRPPPGSAAQTPTGQRSGATPRFRRAGTATCSTCAGPASPKTRSAAPWAPAAARRSVVEVGAAATAPKPDRRPEPARGGVEGRAAHARARSPWVRSVRARRLARDASAVDGGERDRVGSAAVRARPMSTGRHLSEKAPTASLTVRCIACAANCQVSRRNDVARSSSFRTPRALNRTRVFHLSAQLRSAVRLLCAVRLLRLLCCAAALARSLARVRVRAHRRAVVRRRRRWSARCRPFATMPWRWWRRWRRWPPGGEGGRDDWYAGAAAHGGPLPQALFSVTAPRPTSRHHHAVTAAL